MQLISLLATAVISFAWSIKAIPPRPASRSKQSYVSTASSQDDNDQNPLHYGLKKDLDALGFTWGRFDFVSNQLHAILHNYKDQWMKRSVNILSLPSTSRSNEPAWKGVPQFFEAYETQTRWQSSPANNNNLNLLPGSHNLMRILQADGTIASAPISKAGNPFMILEQCSDSLEEKWQDMRLGEFYDAIIHAIDTAMFLLSKDLVYPEGISMLNVFRCPVEGNPADVVLRTLPVTKLVKYSEITVKDEFDGRALGIQFLRQKTWDSKLGDWDAILWSTHHLCALPVFVKALTEQEMLFCTIALNSPDPKMTRGDALKTALSARMENLKKIATGLRDAVRAGDSKKRGRNSDSEDSSKKRPKRPRKKEAI